MKLCRCGCGESVINTKRYAQGHAPTSWNNGIKMSESTREKMRIANIGRKHSIETKQKIGAASRGRLVSEDTKQKIKQGLLGKKRTKPSWNKDLTKETDMRVAKCVYNYPKHRKKPNVSVEERQYKRIKFSGENNPNFNPNKTAFQKYEIACKFDFNLGAFPEEFDLVKIRDMFHPTNNKRGYTRDHMFSIYDGFKKQVAPELLKHPANCCLMLHADNSKKHTNSTISIEELKQRIIVWDNKYVTK